MITATDSPRALYDRVRELFTKGFRIDWVTASFISITHVLCLISTPIVYYYAPPGFWQWMLGWTLTQALIGSLSTTVYSHRLIAHGAATHISWPVHILFGFIGQVLAMQGSVRQWAANHVIHHCVDRTGEHHLDPYSATWFSSGWRNFLWSHVLTYFFFHPENEANERAFAAKNETLLVWQDRLYLPLLIVLNFLLPLVVGYLIGGTLLTAFALMIAAIGGFILAQHNTWTVNSVTHMWGFTRGARSSARNNYLWMGPMGEGNHHADHHDFARDYRNGFGWSGWLLDPSRYVILLLRGLGLVKGLRRASKRQEAEIIARRKLRDAQAKTTLPSWKRGEAYLLGLKAEWIDAVQRWETYRTEKLKIKRQIRTMTLPSFELNQRLENIKAELAEAKVRMRKCRQEFFDAIYLMGRSGAAA